MGSESFKDILAQLGGAPKKRDAYPLPVTEDEADELLTAAIREQIAFRGGEMTDSSTWRHIVASVAHWLTTTEKTSLFLCGTVGNGKTTVLKAIQRLYQLSDVRDWQGKKVGVYITTARDVVRRWREDYKTFSRLCEEPLLGIDDLGTEPKEIVDYGNIGNPMIELFEKRYDGQLTTIVTSNLTTRQVRQDYYDRVADRFNEMMEIIVFDAPSYRGKSL